MLHSVVSEKSVNTKLKTSEVTTILLENEETSAKERFPVFTFLHSGVIT